MQLTGPFASIFAHRSLLFALTKRDILGRYRGASFGLLWSLISPFLMLIVYTIAFGYIMRAKWPGAGESNADFAVLVYLGLLAHGFLAECMTRAPGLIVGNPNFVKKVVFPLEILPAMVVLSALFHALMNFAVYVLLSWVLISRFEWSTFLAPLMLIPLAFVGLAIAYLFSSMAVFFRDLSQMVGVMATAMLFLSSAIVPVEALPKNYQFVFALNPLTFIIDQMRAVAFWGRSPDWSGLALYSVLAFIALIVSYALFQRVRGGFADVV